MVYLPVYYKRLLDERGTFEPATEWVLGIESGKKQAASDDMLHFPQY